MVFTEKNQIAPRKRKLNALIEEMKIFLESYRSSFRISGIIGIVEE